MKTAVSVPDPIFTAADRLARRKGFSRSQLYSEALKDYLRRHGEDGLTQAINRCYADQSEAMDSAFLAAQTHAVSRDKW